MIQTPMARAADLRHWLAPPLLVAALAAVALAAAASGRSQAVDPPDEHERADLSSLMQVSVPAGRSTSGAGLAQATERSPDLSPAYLPVLRRDGLVHGDGLFRARSVAAGIPHTCAVDLDGALWCWGGNVRGILGVGSDDFTLSSARPRQVTGFGEPVSEVASGPFLTCVTTASGAGWCWGENRCGQVGRGDDLDHCDEVPPVTAPARVRGLHTGVIALAAGYEHACALVLPGAVKCWGADQSHRVQATPALVAGLESDVVALTAGLDHTCALLAGGAVKCWGWFSNGGFDSATPATPPGWESGIRAVAAGATHVCALRTNGIVECWGQNEQGQLGQGMAGWDQPTVPAPVVGLPTAARAITAGGATTCATLTDGRLWCWGYNEGGQLGRGQADTDPHPRPELVAAQTLPVVGAATSSTFPMAFGGCGNEGDCYSSAGSHSCAILVGARLQCWGGNELGQLGDATFAARYVPGDVRIAADALPTVALQVCQPR